MLLKKVTFVLFTFTCIASLYAQQVKVNSVKELLQQIGSNKTIELAPGTYNISENKDTLINPNITWINNYDGNQPTISNVSNLTLKGGKDVKIVLEPRYAWVMSFYNCNALNFSNITFGHTEAGYCMGGVLSFTNCNNVTISNCPLYGSGTVGTMIENCNNISYKNCDVYECTYGLAYVYSSNNISFENTSFRKTGEFDLIEILGCKNVRFSSCTFSENYNGNFMPHLFTIDSNIWTDLGTSKNQIKSENIVIENCSFNNNKVQKFANDVTKLTLKGNKFKGNVFQTP